MSSSLPIEVGYKKVLGAPILISSLFILGVAFYTGALMPQAFTGAILLVMGFCYLTQPAIVVTETEVQLRNVFGMTMRRYPLTHLKELKVVDGGLVVGGERVKMAPWLLSSADMARVEEVAARAGEQ